ncbi:hypothetical protein [Actinoplanes sp. NPDC049316]|uniref:hypothetical protein n=1 Tax=Actinoplanes sp. NPDC049316 TaxID=3154727 RepID=UPI003430A1F3
MRGRKGHIERYRRDDNYSFALPGHRFGRGVDERTAAVFGRSTFEADVILAGQEVSKAEALLADAVGGREAIFTAFGGAWFREAASWWTPPSIGPAPERAPPGQVMNPRDAYFAETEQVADPVGRIAGMISPYPPGIPAILPANGSTPR